MLCKDRNLLFLSTLAKKMLTNDNSLADFYERIFLKIGMSVQLPQFVQHIIGKCLTPINFKLSTLILINMLMIPIHSLVS